LDKTFLPQHFDFPGSLSLKSKEESPNEFPLDNAHLALHNETIKTNPIYAKLTFNHKL